MPEVKIRKILSCIEEIYHEGGPRAETPQRRASIIAVIENPFA
ncbi:MAG: amino acid synthesis family protein, partial [Rhodobacterales bacterium]